MTKSKATKHPQKSHTSKDPAQPANALSLGEPEVPYGAPASEQAGQETEQAFGEQNEFGHSASEGDMAKMSAQVAVNASDISRIVAGVKELAQQQLYTSKRVIEMTTQLDSLKEKLDLLATKEYVDGKFNLLSEQIATLGGRLDKHEQTTNDRFDKFEQATNDRFDKFEQATNDRFDKFEQATKEMFREHRQETREGFQTLQRWFIGIGTALFLLIVGDITQRLLS